MLRQSAFVFLALAVMPSSQFWFPFFSHYENMLEPQQIDRDFGTLRNNFNPQRAENLNEQNSLEDSDEANEYQKMVKKRPYEPEGQVIGNNDANKESVGSQFRNSKNGTQKLLVSTVKSLTTNLKSSLDKNSAVDNASIFFARANLNGYCDSSLNCSTKNSICDSGSCLCDPTRYVKKPGDLATCYEKKSYNESCRFNLQCGNGQICKSVCKCRPQYTWVERKAACYPDSHLHGLCTITEQCSNGGTSNAECFGSRCRCKVGYKVFKKTCKKAILGRWCSTSDTCSDDNAVCLEERCTCRDGYVQKPGDAHTCYPSTTMGNTNVNSTTTTTTTTTDTTTTMPLTCIAGYCDYYCTCSSMANSRCLDSECVCFQSHIEYEGRCVELKNYNESCEQSKQCGGRHQVCSDQGLCECKRNAYYSMVYGCIEYMYLQEDCIEDDQCTHHATHSQCSPANKQCTCKRGYEIKVNDMKECVTKYIKLNGTFSLVGVAYTAHHGNVNSASYSYATRIVNAIVLVLEGVEGIDSLHFNNNSGTVEAVFTLTVKNPETVSNFKVLKNPWDTFQRNKRQADGERLMRLEDHIQHQMQENAQKNDVEINDVQSRMIGN